LTLGELHLVLPASTKRNGGGRIEYLDITVYMNIHFMILTKQKIQKQFTREYINTYFRNTNGI
jgi:hypothetical protein